MQDAGSQWIAIELVSICGSGVSGFIEFPVFVFQNICPFPCKPGVGRNHRQEQFVFANEKNMHMVKSQTLQDDLG